MKTLTIGEIHINELPCGDVELVAHRRRMVRAQFSSAPGFVPGEPVEEFKIIIPAAKRTELAELLLSRDFENAEEMIASAKHWKDLRR